MNQSINQPIHPPERTDSQPRNSRFPKEIESTTWLVCFALSVLSIFDTATFKVRCQFLRAEVLPVCGQVQRKTSPTRTTQTFAVLKK
jgi:hypothetical protein